MASITNERDKLVDILRHSFGDVKIEITSEESGGNVIDEFAVYLTDETVVKISDYKKAILDALFSERINSTYIDYLRNSLFKKGENSYVYLFGLKHMSN